MQIIITLLDIIAGILFTVIPFGVLYLVIKYSANQARKDNLSKIDFAKDKEYYRTILKIYSPAELSYIDDFRVNYKREIVSTILSLELKGKIKIESDGISILDNSDENLRKTEKYILKNINNKKVRLTDSGYIESYAQDEAIEDELIIKNTEQIGIERVKKKIFFQIITSFIALLVFVILRIYYEKMKNINTGLQIINIIFSILSFSIIFFEVSYGFIGTLVYSLMQRESYRRSEKGEELNKKIEGLKQYIKDYSLLKNKDKDALKIWEEYLIYSVIFDINDTNIVQEILNFVEIEFERGKIYFEKS